MQSTESNTVSQQGAYPKGRRRRRKALKELHKSAKLQVKTDKLKGLMLQRGMVVVAIVNPLSGAQLGEMVMCQLRDILGPEHVFHAISDNITTELSSVKGVANLRVLACGGDGTYHHVIQAMVDLGFSPLPPVGTIPLGTGNDLARQFGWGRSLYPNRKKIIKLICKLITAHVTPLDLWQVKVIPKDPDTMVSLQDKATLRIMFNYFSLGFEAGVSYRFDRYRKRHSQLFKSRRLNQIGYACNTLLSIFNGGNKPLDNLIQVCVNGSIVETPKDLVTLVVLNFKNYQAGLDIWGQPKGDGFVEPSANDQKAEVVGLGGVVHEFQVRTHMCKGYHLAQGFEIKIQLFTDFPVSYDGEPAIQIGPCEVQLVPYCKANILTKP